MDKFCAFYKTRGECPIFLLPAIMAEVDEDGPKLDVPVSSLKMLSAISELSGLPLGPAVTAVTHLWMSTSSRAT